jgi:hypothetical protein
MCVLLAMLGSQRHDYSTDDMLTDLMAAIFHDSDEKATGDIAWPAKNAMPAVADQIGEFGQVWLAERGVPNFECSYFVKMVDRLDAYLHMLTVAPELQHVGPWKTYEQMICDGARTLKIGNQVVALIAVAKRRDWE